MAVNVNRPFAFTGQRRFHQTMVETSEPQAPPANTGTFFFRQNESGKTQYCVKYDDNTVSVLTTQP